ncbi:ester cyclase [Nocardioides ungokensis]|uniref:ester cyclase n=1 Tax=Nocardioides ungokensis TaxID=1643322 RepID=UPI0015DFFF06|nr:ester cyclase [Nocardioides ungokensis]
MDNVATMRRVYELLSAGDIDGFGDLLAADFVEHEDAPGLEPTKEGVLQLFRMYRAAFPDLQMNVDELLPSGDKVVARITASGTHTGDDFMGVPASGKKVRIEVFDIIRFDDQGRACEHWGAMDALGMMQQLGAIPTMAPPA